MQGVFIGTFLIGLREGLEATLIVSIVGAFLKRNGQSTRPMFAGVALAVVISIGVGVGLDVLSAALPQAQQEMMETVIGAIAVALVTSMIIWMNRNAPRLKGELEREARQAINRGGSIALVAMAFLAVLKEGFETAVFLLAAAETSHGSRWAAALGGTLGIAAAIAVGAGLFLGGLKLNLARFFRVTGVFLVLIAAGLVLSALRTAHEAGWLTIGQQQVLDLRSWMPITSLQGALITGVFGVPADPRLVEVLGWLLYTVPVLVVFLWPAIFSASTRGRRRVLAAVSAALLAVAAALAIAVPDDRDTSVARTRTVTDHQGHTATLSFVAKSGARSLSVGPTVGAELRAAGTQSFNGTMVQVWQASVPADAGDAAEVTLEQLMGMTGGRLPIGVTAARTPGPFRAQWAATTAYTVAAHGDSVVSARAASNRTAVLTGGGLAAPKTVSVGGLPGDWSTASAEDQSVAAQIVAADRARAERQLWKAWLPLVLAAFALACLVPAARRPAGRNSDTISAPKGEANHGESRRADTVPVS
jgi:high-affinity iron transporter